MPCCVRGRAQRAKSSSVPSSGCTASWPPSAGADRVRRAGIVRAGDERVVAALAVLAADRVDRREVEDVEAELGDRRDLLLDRLQAAPRAREQLVPGAEARAHAVDLDRRPAVEPRRAVALGGRAAIAVEQVGRQRGLGRRRAPPSSATSSARSIVARSSPLSARLAASSSSTTPSESSPARSSCPAGDLALQLVAPGGERSIQASIVHSQRPGVSTVNSPAQRTPLMCASIGCIGASCQRRPPGAR